MTQAEYDKYKAAVDAFWKREQLETFSSGSVEHNYDGECTSEEHEHDSNGDYLGEPFFSWRRCDCCGSTLGGDRETYIGWSKKYNKVVGDYHICADCVYYNEYGQLDDMTMMDNDLR